MICVPFSAYLAARGHISHFGVLCIHAFFSGSHVPVLCFDAMEELNIVSTKSIFHTGTTAAYLGN